MISLRNIVAAVAGSTLISAGCCDVNIILNDITALQLAINHNIGNITAYSGGFTGLVGLSAAGVEVTVALGKADVDVKAASSFSSDESKQVLDAISPAMYLVLESLSALNDKETLFRAAGINAEVKTSLGVHALEEQTLFNDISLKSVAEYRPNFTWLQEVVAASYNNTVTKYS